MKAAEVVEATEGRATKKNGETRCAEKRRERNGGVCGGGNREETLELLEKVEKQRQDKTRGIMGGEVM